MVTTSHEVHILSDPVMEDGHHWEAAMSPLVFLGPPNHFRPRSNMPGRWLEDVRGNVSILKKDVWSKKKLHRPQFTETLSDQNPFSRPFEVGVLGKSHNHHNLCYPFPCWPQKWSKNENLRLSGQWMKAPFSRKRGGSWLFLGGGWGGCHPLGFGPWGEPPP